MSDQTMAVIARALVEALKDAGYSRSEADRKHELERAKGKETAGV